MFQRLPGKLTAGEMIFLAVMRGSRAVGMCGHFVKLRGSLMRILRHMISFRALANAAIDGTRRACKYFRGIDAICLELPFRRHRHLPIAWSDLDQLLSGWPASAAIRFPLMIRVQNAASRKAVREAFAAPRSLHQSNERRRSIEAQSSGRSEWPEPQPVVAAE